VTHRLDIRETPSSVTLEFEGFLDPAALEKLRAALESAAARGAAVRVVLREGTDVDRACVDGLRALAAEVVAESPYLARWIRGDAP
jgi:hypothetical protein